MSRASLDQRSDFRSLIDELDGVAVWLASGSDRFDYISDGFEEIWGIPPENVQDDPARLLETIHPDDRERVRSQIQQSDPESAMMSYEGRVVRPDGSIRWVQTRQFPIRDDGGNVTNVVGVCTDITEQKRRENELAALNRIVRHDIRNDMNILLGWAEQLEDHVDDDGRDHLQRVLNAGERVVELTEVAGEYAKTVTSGTAVELHPVSLRSTLRHELELRRESFPDAEFTVDGEIPDVEVQANEMLESVFRNLLNNAVQHNDKDTPIVEIRCDLTDEAAVVEIADNGPGIPDDRKASLFEQRSKGLDSSGSGIGLYLVQTLVEQYGGTVAVEDRSPTGSVFTVRLPRAD